MEDSRRRETNRLELLFYYPLHFGKWKLVGNVQLDDAGLNGLPIINTPCRGFPLSWIRRRSHWLRIGVTGTIGNRELL